MSKSANLKLSHEQFALQAIHALREGSHLGIHVVYSGFNGAFRQYFGEDPVAVIEQLASQGKIISRPAKGGAVIFDPKDKPIVAPSTDKVLGKILEG